MKRQIRISRDRVMSCRTIIAMWPTNRSAATDSVTVSVREPSAHDPSNIFAVLSQADMSNHQTYLKTKLLVGFSSQVAKIDPGTQDST